MTLYWAGINMHTVNNTHAIYTIPVTTPTKYEKARSAFLTLGHIEKKKKNRKPIQNTN